MALGKSNKKLSIQITDTSINILIGNKSRIYETHTIALENGDCRDGTVRDRESIIRLLNEYLEVNARDVHTVSFVLRGADIITRYIEVPILKDNALREAVNYEFQQFIPDIEDYYTNYEVVEKISTQEKKAYKILLVAATKEKVNPIVAIAEGIGKELEVIDILSNSLARVIRNSDHVTSEESTGVFYFGADSSTLSIIENNILKFERNLPFGVKNIFNEAYEEVAATTLEGREVTNLFEGDDSLKRGFENLLTSVNNTIRYYNSDKNNKPVTNFIIICSDIIASNMEKYIEKYFEMPCVLVKDPIDLGLKVKFEENFAKYIADYGLLLRGNDTKLLNLAPKAINKEKSKGNLDKVLVNLTVITLLGLVVISVPFIIMNKVITKDITAVEENIAKYVEIVEKNTQLKVENSNMEAFINRIKGVEDNTTKTSAIITKINSYIPKEIEFANMTFSDSGSIEISGESSTYEAIPKFLANLQMSNEFTNAKISFINPIEKTITQENTEKTVANVSTRSSLLPVAMVGSNNIWGNIQLLSSANSNENSNGTTNNTDNTNSGKPNINQSDAENNTNNNGTNNSTNGTNNNTNGTNNSTNGTNNGTNNSGTTNTKTITAYSFSISIEGVSKDGSEAKKAE